MYFSFFRTKTFFVTFMIIHRYSVIKKEINNAKMHIRICPCKKMILTHVLCIRKKGYSITFLILYLIMEGKIFYA